MDSEKRFELVKSIGEEIITEEELKTLLETNDKPIAYDGFEPSGLAHLPFGVYRALTLKKLLEANVHFKLYLADYFAFVNNKLEGDLNLINTCGDYFIEVWKAAGIPIKKVEIIKASELMDSLKYWNRVLTVAKNMTLNRTKRAMSIAGRKETDELHTAQLFYPAMQVADIFEMDVDICQLGLDQRRANILAREVAEKMHWKKPVALHHHMLLGLQGLDKSGDVIDSKMSKSKPETCIFVHDSFEEIKKKINTAYCLPKDIVNNPLLDYSKHIIFQEFKEMKIERPEKFGGNLAFNSYAELETAFASGNLHPLDLKNGVSFYLNELIKPIRGHFEKDAKAKKLYEAVRDAKKTR
ncbi:MAG: tyrosine--tRNA ligase [Candidatus Diapherotrites archaeon CG08_land_8_20_14_0_20_34_12]|nr:MAG: tyrosine--tRNA ligase [Candidatus Diapherotrites archaeon CG08_land_8_20_14_0_20_34_12]